jgi:proteic killer suppression protein
MIRSFKNKATRAIAGGHAPNGFSGELLRAAQRKLFLIEHAVELKDLATPPGNRLEALKGKRTGQYSIRANDQFRICFRWADGNAEDVELSTITDDGRPRR